jgi:hypothetical protein
MVLLSSSQVAAASVMPLATCEAAEAIRSAAFRWRPKIALAPALLVGCRHRFDEAPGG